LTKTILFYVVNQDVANSLKKQYDIELYPQHPKARKENIMTLYCLDSHDLTLKSEVFFLIFPLPRIVLEYG